jgi:hypothetical protein
MPFSRQNGVLRHGILCVWRVFGRLRSKSVETWIVVPAGFTLAMHYLPPDMPTTMAGACPEAACGNTVPEVRLLFSPFRYDYSEEARS